VSEVSQSVSMRSRQRWKWRSAGLVPACCDDDNRDSGTVADTALTADSANTTIIPIRSNSLQC